MIINKLGEVMQDKPLTARSIHALSRTTESLATVVRLLNDLAESGKLQRRYQQGRYWYGKSPNVFGERFAGTAPKPHPAIVRRQRIIAEHFKHNGRRDAIMAYVRKRPACTMREIVDHLAVEKKQVPAVRNAIAKCVEAGLLVKHGRQRSGVYMPARRET